MLKRLNYVKRRLKTRANWNLFPQDSDQQLLRRQEQAHYTLIICFGFFVINIGIDKLFESPEGYGFEFFTSVATFLYLIYLCYSMFRLRWALEAFEQFGPQSTSDLERSIVEADDASQIPR